jgi:hypothetical protein
LICESFVSPTLEIREPPLRLKPARLQNPAPHTSRSRGGGLPHLERKAVTSKTGIISLLQAPYQEKAEQYQVVKVCFIQFSDRAQHPPSPVAVIQKALPAKLPLFQVPTDD